MADRERHRAGADRGARERPRPAPAPAPAAGNAATAAVLGTALSRAGRSTDPGGGPLAASTATAIHDELGKGAPLGEGVRRHMEGHFGTDLSAVRIHDGGRADALSRAVHAEAFTTGADIFFAAGRFAPDSADGRRLLAHELTHVVQQAAGTAGAAGRVSHPDDAHEVEARAVGDLVASARAPSPEGAPAGARAAAGGVAAPVLRQVQRVAGNRAAGVAVHRQATEGGRTVPGTPFRYELNFRGNPYVKGMLRLDVKPSAGAHEADDGPRVGVGVGTPQLRHERSLSRGRGGVSSKVESMVAASLLKVEGASGPLPGLPWVRFAVDVKALEAKVASLTDPARIDLLKAAVRLEGSVDRLPDPFGAMPGIYDIRLSGGVSVSLPLELAAKLRVAVLARREALRAAQEARRVADQVDRRTRQLERARQRTSRLEQQASRLEQQLAELTAEERRLEAERSRANQARRTGGRGTRASAAARRRQINRQLQTVRAQLRTGTRAAEAAATRLDATRRAAARVGERLRSAAETLQQLQAKATGPAKELLEKMAADLHRRLNRRLGGRILAKLVPGLAVISTVADLYELGKALYHLGTGEARLGFEEGAEGPAGATQPGGTPDATGAHGTGGADGTGDGGGGEGGGTGPGDGFPGGGADAGTPADASLPAGAPAPAGVDHDHDPAGGVRVRPAPRTLLEALHDGGAPRLGPVEVAALDQVIPTSWGPEQVARLVEQARALRADDGIDLLVAVERLVRAQQAAALAPAPTTLLPGTAAHLRRSLDWDPAAGRVRVPPDELAAILDSRYTLADGLQTFITDIVAGEPRPLGTAAGTGEVVAVTVDVVSEVAALPAHAGPDYPWRVGQLHADRVNLLLTSDLTRWGTFEALPLDAVRPALEVDGLRYRARAGTVVQLGTVTATVEAVVSQTPTRRPDGTVAVDVVLRVIPRSLGDGSAQPGYTSGGTWTPFEVGRPAHLDLRFVHGTRPTELVDERR